MQTVNEARDPGVMDESVTGFRSAPVTPSVAAEPVKVSRGGPMTGPGPKKRSGFNKDIGYNTDELTKICYEGSVISRAIEVFKSKPYTPERSRFVRDYIQLMTLYEKKLGVFSNVIQDNCVRTVVDARIPLLIDTMIAPVDDETKEDADQKFIVKKKFVEAIEMMQGTRAPSKRRGNLPKDAIETFKTWITDHYKNPCKLN